jgi:glucosamine-6-phosphate deaminase
MTQAVRVQRQPDAAAVAEQAAARLLAGLAGPRPVGLATGRTMEPVYGALRRQLAALPAAQRAALLAGWRSFNLDEYVGLAPSDPRSFAATMAAALAGPLELRPGQLQLPDGMAPWPDQEARRYAAAVAEAGGIGLQLLGLGSNGHVGFNEPPCGVEAPCRCLELTAATALQNASAFGGDPAAVPSRAITLGMAEILAAEEILLVVTGAAKAEILRRALEEPPSATLPASWLQQHPRLTVLVDPPAASRLRLS